MRRKEDPRLITGRATYVDDITLPGTLFAAIVRSTEAHARIVSIDTSAATERADVEAVFTGEDLMDVAAPVPMVWAPPGVEVKVPEHWPLARGKVGLRGPARGRRARRGQVRRGGRRRGGRGRVRPAARGRRSRGRPGGGLGPRARGVRHEPVLRVVARRRRRGRRARGGRRGIERRVVNHRTAGRRHRAARLPRRVAGGLAHHVELHADPAHRAGDPLHRARHLRGPDPRGGARGGRGLRLQAPGLPRGDARLLVREEDEPPGQVDRHALGRHGHHASRARPDRLRAHRGQARRHAHGHPRQGHPGPRRLPPASRAR